MKAKRKRDDAEFDRTSTSVSPTPSLSTVSLQGNLLIGDINVGGNSPHAAVAGQFQELDLHGCSCLNIGLDRTSHEHRDTAHIEAEVDGGTSGDSAMDINSTFTEILEPSEPKTQPQTTQDDEATSTSATPSHSRSQPASGVRITPRRRRKSPPLADNPDEDPLTWHDSEITVFDPTDPNDDGYGINGVGFKPTATIAWDRLQKRKKQISEWKSREAREAREKRRERRDGIVDECSKPEANNSSRKKVKFDT